MMMRPIDIAGGAPRKARLSRPAPHRPRPAFTLVEMLVALVVLVVALAVVTTVFRVTSQTARQSTALTEVQTRLGTLVERLRADLDAIDPAQSLLVIHGRAIPAARTDDDLAARRYLRFLLGDPNDVPGAYQPEFDPDLDSATDPEYSDPRADILMFLTNNAQPSQAPPNPPPAQSPAQPDVWQLGARGAPLLVKYGHAAIDRVVPVGNATPPIFDYASNSGPASLRHVSRRATDGTNRSELPALRWHLSRVATIIDPNAAGNKMTLSAAPLFGGPADYPRILRCDNFTNPRLSGDLSKLNVGLLLRQFGPYPTLSLTQPAAEESPYSFAPPSLGPHWPGALRSLIFDNLGPGGEQDFTTAAGLRHVATVLENPPGNLLGNLGVHGLPACAWFHVEFLMPEDPRNARDYYDRADSGIPNNANRRSDLPRWVSVPDGQTFVFVPDTAHNAAVVAERWPANGQPNGARVFNFGKLDRRLGPDPQPPLPADSPGNRKIRMWPYAIRITLRVYDPAGRLANPVERTIVHRFD